MRSFLLALAASIAALPSPLSAQTGPAEVNRLPVSAVTAREAYGPAPMQFGELRLPPGPGPFPVAVIIHGGCWLRGMASLAGTAPIATALAARGIATWNIEYRALGDEGGGWPGSYQDWGAATDHLRGLARRHPLDLSRIVVIGHSAGAPAALFVAARPRLPASAETRGADPLPVAAAVAIDGPPELTPLIGADVRICGSAVISRLMGGTPASHPARYAEVSPVTHLPLRARQYMVSASPVLRREWAEAYRAQAAARGDIVEILFPVGGDHFNIIMPGRPQWTEVERFIVERAFGLLPTDRATPAH